MWPTFWDIKVLKNVNKLDFDQKIGKSGQILIIL